MPAWLGITWPTALRDVPMLIPGMLVSLVVGIAVGRKVGRMLNAGPVAGAMLVFGIGLILAATLTPLRDPLGFHATPPGPCDLDRIGPPAWEDLFFVNDTSLNVLLFIPLGAAVGLVPRSRRQAILIVLAIALSLVIETIQLLAPVLDRACESADVGDNLTGLVIGLAIGTLATGVLAVADGLRGPGKG